MHNHDVIIIDSAENQYNDIIKYLNNDLHNPQAANSFIDAVEQKIKLISKFPYIGSIYNSNIKLAHKFYKVKIMKYVMFYTIDESKNKIYISYFYHSSQNIKLS